MTTATGKMTVDGVALTATASFTVTTPTTTDPLGPRKVWVLQEVTSKSQLLTVYRSQIANCKATVPAVGGFGLRIAWDNYLADKSIIDAGKMIADENGLDFSFRFMAGRHTPAAVLTQMGPNYTHTTPAGELFPKPFASDGSAGNPVFEAAFRALLEDLADWYDANDCHLLHNSWWAMDWAELNHGAEIRAAAGYSQAAWLDGHKRLVTIAAQVQAAHPGIVMEFPLSGYGPVTNANNPEQGLSAQIADHMASVFGANKRNLSIQANGWSNAGQWGTTPSNDALFDVCWSRPLARGVQAIQPWGVSATYPQYTASQITGAIAQATSCDADYMEIYTPTLRSVNGGAAWATPLANWINGSY